MLNTTARYAQHFLLAVLLKLLNQKAWVSQLPNCGVEGGKLEGQLQSHSNEISHAITGVLRLDGTNSNMMFFYSFITM